MTDDETNRGGADGQYNRMAIGTALGIPIGVALSLILDNWAMVGVGIALGASFGLLPSSKSSPSEESAAADSDDS
jgi:hypothetical protein